MDSGRNAVLDSGGLSFLVARSHRSLAVASSMKRRGLWPPVVSTMTMIEALQGRPGPDASTNQFLKSCRIEPVVSEKPARRAALLRNLAGRGSAEDALVVALAEPKGLVITGDNSDIGALADRADDVCVEST